MLFRDIVWALFQGGRVWRISPRVTESFLCLMSWGVWLRFPFCSFKLSDWTQRHRMPRYLDTWPHMIQKKVYSQLVICSLGLYFNIWL